MIYTMCFTRYLYVVQEVIQLRLLPVIQLRLLTIDYPKRKQYTTILEFGLKKKNGISILDKILQKPVKQISE